MCEFYYTCQAKLVRQSLQLVPQLTSCPDGKFFFFDSMSCSKWLFVLIFCLLLQILSKYFTYGKVNPGLTTDNFSWITEEDFPCLYFTTEAAVTPAPPIETTSYSPHNTNIPVELQVKCSSNREVPELQEAAKKIHCNDIVLCVEGTAQFVVSNIRLTISFNVRLRGPTPFFTNSGHNYHFLFVLVFLLALMVFDLFYFKIFFKYSSKTWKS